MPRGRRTLLCAALALLVPLPAFALSGEEGAGTLSVSASLGKCGLVQSEIVCEIGASWSGIEHADYYTLSVTRADGSVLDYGQATGSGTSLWVPYAGSGTYSVEVTAWGEEPGDEEPEVLAREEVSSSGTKTRSTQTKRGLSPAPAGEPRPLAGAESPEAGAETPDEPEPVPSEERPACEKAEDEAEQEALLEAAATKSAGVEALGDAAEQGEADEDAVPPDEQPEDPDCP